MGIANKIADAAEDLGGSIVDTAQDAGEAIVDTAEHASNGAADATDSASNAATTAAEDASNAAADAKDALDTAKDVAHSISDNIRDTLTFGLAEAGNNIAHAAGDGMSMVHGVVDLVRAGVDTGMHRLEHTFGMLTLTAVEEIYVTMVKDGTNVDRKVDDWMRDQINQLRGDADTDDGSQSNSGTESSSHSDSHGGGVWALLDKASWAMPNPQPLPPTPSDNHHMPPEYAIPHYEMPVLADAFAHHLHI